VIGACKESSIVWYIAGVGLFESSANKMQEFNWQALLCMAYDHWYDPTLRFFLFFLGFFLHAQWTLNLIKSSGCIITPLNNNPIKKTLNINKN